MYVRTFLVYLLTATLALAQDRQGPPIQLDLKLWGWADLHAHPATHLAFGADANGNGGIFWGKPGLKWTADYQDLDDDLPACSYKHGGTDGDVVRHETHKALMENLDSVTELPHQTSDFGENNFGGHTYAQWPHARSVTHQQMHVTQLRRAWEGGQRLMIASVTDNEFLADMWTKVGYNAGGNPVPSVDPNFGYNSAKRQIAFIKKLADANSDWMDVVTSAAEARHAIVANKLAIILSLELDTISPSQVLKLVKEDGVRQVIPVHLVNNRMGGTAVYNDAFNAVNNFLHSTRDKDDNLNLDGFFDVLYDPLMTFRLGWPSYPRPEGFNLVKGGAINIDPVPLVVWIGLGYDTPGALGGHRNTLGLTTEGKTLVKDLAKLGVLIDVAHMSQRSTRDTLNLVKPWDYPVMDSHTGLRAEDNTAISERDLHRSHAQTIADLGGVIGFGTEGEAGYKVVISKKTGNPYVKFATSSQKAKDNKAVVQQSWNLSKLSGDPEVSHMVIRTKTGDNALSSDLIAGLTINGKSYSFRLNKFHEDWRPTLVNNSHIEVPAGTKTSELTKLTLSISGGDTLYDLDEFEVKVVLKEQDTVKAWLDGYKDVLSVMKGKGVALGTDINGLAPQLWLAGESVSYPLDVVRKYGSKSAALIPASHMGSRTFNFKNDGIAHYGMLVDFLQAVSDKDGSDEAMNALFRSANDVVLMWEKCEKSAKDID